MNKAQLYQRANSLQRRDAKQVLDEFSHLIQWRGKDSLLDIGCGSGDVTIDYILPLMPTDFSRLVGADISDPMIRFAREKFKSIKRTSFLKLDIGSEIDKFTWRLEPFDHIMSFYCLHWVQNQHKAIENIYNLLQTDGDCLLTFLASMPIFEIYEQMSRTHKWGCYMTEVNQYISPYQNSKNPASDFGDIMYSAGFSEFRIEIRDSVYIYEGIESLKKSVKAVNPFLEKIPLKLHEEFLVDYVSCVEGMNLLEVEDSNNRQGDKTRIITPYKLIVAYGRK